MTTSIHEELHHDHVIWQAEINHWQDEIELWKSELQEAEGQLKDLEMALKTHRDALAAHASAIRERALATQRHESAIVKYESGEAGDELPAMAVAHEQEATSQDLQRKAHERIRRHHHSVIANWSLLLRAIDHPM